jgi:hypothetical protein
MDAILMNVLLEGLNAVFTWMGIGGLNIISIFYA